MYQLLRLAGLLDALPLPPGSAQADMVAAGIANRATLPEREVCNHVVVRCALRCVIVYCAVPAVHLCVWCERMACKVSSPRCPLLSSCPLLSLTIDSACWQ